MPHPASAMERFSPALARAPFRSKPPFPLGLGFGRRDIWGTLRASQTIRSWSFTSLRETWWARSFRWLATFRWARPTASQARRRCIEPRSLVETARWAPTNRSCAFLANRPSRTSSPSLVATRAHTPRSIPTDWPVAGSGWAGTSAQRMLTHHRWPSRDTVIALGVPRSARCMRSLTCPIPSSRNRLASVSRPSPWCPPTAPNQSATRL